MNFFTKHYLLTFFCGTLLFTACNASQKLELEANTSSPLLVNLKGNSPLFEDAQREEPSFEFELSFEYFDEKVAGKAYSKMNQCLLEYALGESYSSMPINEAFKSFIEHELRSYRRDWADLIQEIGEKPNANNFLHLKGKIREQIENSVLVYEIESSEYRGGAHGSETKTFLNFNLTTGTLLRLEDVFLDAKNSPELAQLLIKKAISDGNLESENALISPFFISPNFALGKTGILFYYNSCELLPYSSGPLEIELSYKSLKQFLSPKIAFKID